MAVDADFVSAAKHARIKDIDFILNPLWQRVPPSLSEYIGGEQSYNLISSIYNILNIEPDPRPDCWDKMIEKKKRKKQKKRKKK